jgi:hypothetical protein
MITFSFLKNTLDLTTIIFSFHEKTSFLSAMAAGAATIRGAGAAALCRFNFKLVKVVMMTDDVYIGIGIRCAKGL